MNKRKPGLTGYQQKCQRLYHAGVHLTELDLLRHGTRPISHARVATVPYLVTLPRADVLQSVYAETAYDLSIDYTDEPLPALNATDRQGMRDLLR